MTMDSSIEKQLEFVSDAAGHRLDKFLAEKLSGYSRTEVQRWIKSGNVLVNGSPSRPGYRLEPGDRITVGVPAPEPYEIAPEPIPLDVRYEDEDLLVVNKPAGMVTHPSAGHLSGTLVNAVLYHVPDLAGVGGVERPGIVHRLDKDTSGLIIVAKNDRAHRFLQAQFKGREVEKRYEALLFGFLTPRKGRIEAPIGRDVRDRKKMSVVPPGKGRAAITRYKVVGYYRDERTSARQYYTLVEAMPKTGRTHQIRVHMAYIGHPIVGDRVYGHRKRRLPIQRHFLHAGYIRFKRPKDEAWIEVEAELPADLQAVLDILSLEE